MNIALSADQTILASHTDTLRLFLELKSDALEFMLKSAEIAVQSDKTPDQFCKVHTYILLFSIEREKVQLVRPQFTAGIHRSDKDWRLAMMTLHMVHSVKSCIVCATFIAIWLHLLADRW